MLLSERSVGVPEEGRGFCFSLNLNEDSRFLSKLYSGKLQADCFETPQLYPHKMHRSFTSFTQKSPQTLSPLA
eukprot:scaffold15119_cov141-Skeletonema_marinoi.AAC.4